VTTDALAPYRSPEARHREVQRLATAVGAEIVEYGTSVEGEPLVAVRVPATGSTDRRVLCSANIHGPELVGSEVALGLLSALADEHGAAAELRARTEVWVVPCINPDGARRTFDRGGIGPLVALRPNARGVDLNRNFPLPGGARPTRLPGAGSPVPGHATYRGPSPLSEPETAALEQLFAAQGFWASANLHSFMGTAIPARVKDRAAYRTYRDLCRQLRAAQLHTRYRRLAHRTLDVFTGEQEDHQHHVHDTWAVCVEVFSIGASLRQHLLAPSTFWRFNPRQPQRWIDNDVPALVAYFLAAIERPRPSELAPAAIRPS
jgi:predicted deacylase